MVRQQILEFLKSLKINPDNKDFIKKAVTGRIQPFVMRRGMPNWPSSLAHLGLYLHIPFCENLCSYCPYNRIKYQEDLFAQYERAVKAEIDLYAPYLQGQRLVSLYIGGGTPTVNIRGLSRILEYLSKNLAGNYPICIELHPAKMDKECLQTLKSFFYRIYRPA